MSAPRPRDSRGVYRPGKPRDRRLPKSIIVGEADISVKLIVSPASMGTPTVYKLGTVQASEQLLHDLYIDLRGKLRRWAALTKQTPQARMGYVGQHLVSVATGYEGGRSGARGRDLILSAGEFAEIKTCYRIDQLGRCLKCRAPVASIEELCPNCGSPNIKRNDDSKWLVSFRSEEDFKSFLDPKWYYLCLFEFESPPRVDAIQASIWQIDPQTPGFGLCMVDYRYNLQAKSKSRAPFNLWPYSLKFDLMRPVMIYRARISADDSISTLVFPHRDPPKPTHLRPLQEYHRARNVDDVDTVELSTAIGMAPPPPTIAMRSRLASIEAFATDTGVPRGDLADAVARAMYSGRIEPHLANVPPEIAPKIRSMLRN